MIKLPYYFVKKLPLIFLLVKTPPFRCRKFPGPLSNHPSPLLVIYERSLI